MHAIPEKQIYTNKLILDLLHRLPVFSMFSEAELRKMLYSGKLVRIEKYKMGDAIIQEGTFGKWVYLLLKGTVRVVKAGAEICSLNNQGAIIGEIGALKDQARNATVYAATDVICISINIAVVEHMSGEERQQYLDRIHDFLGPLITERLQVTEEVTDILERIHELESELAQLRKRLRQLGASEEKTMLQLILEGKV